MRDPMGMRDRLTGTRHPTDGVVSRSVEDVRAALFALNGPDLPHRVRNALPDEHADLVAQWRVGESAWSSYLVRTHLRQTFKTRMRLVPDACEVHDIDEQRETELIGDPPRLTVGREFRSGQLITVSRRWQVRRDADGRPRIEEVDRFDPVELRHRLREAVLEAGWTWRGVASGRL